MSDAQARACRARAQPPSARDVKRRIHGPERDAGRWHALRRVLLRTEEVAMGRAMNAVRTRDLEELFGFFGLRVEDGLVAAHRAAIQARFGEEVREIARVCTRLHERERFTILREALRLAYESSVLRAAATPAG